MLATLAQAIGPVKETLSARTERHTRLQVGIPNATRPAGDTARAATWTGAILDTYPDLGLSALRNLVRNALWEVHDGPAITDSGGRGHASLGYAYGNADSDPLQSALRKITPSHAPLAVSHLDLLDVRWTAHPAPGDSVRWKMSWDPIARLPLGTA